ncbi:hypothetical protein EYC98_10810 [Halieaceae bacterium IMCC14734]|uniref:VPLPA-CTERM sorting domain-containing protein n=1 Tax=Candidatus Litorirhabdus singularis TaxID=2518993 RepID=A0ABT3TGC6_9GAMM|nr:VPLPA-CTERM sorting domain-containing protein [Candidatus Litorirhabdus singularis]MCX2981355.1 hypothetical protein [Candidatus Litorirhabdus singularis]
MKSTSLLSALSGTALLLSSAFSSAAPLAPNGYIEPLIGTSPFSFGSLIDTTTGSFSVRDVQNSNAIVATGSVTSEVWRAGDNTLTFTWQVVNDISSSASIHALRLGGFGDETFDVGYIDDSNAPGEVPAMTAYRFDGFSAGSFNFQFNEYNEEFEPILGIGSGETSALVFADTDYVDYEQSYRSDLSSGQFQLGDFGANFAPVPSPVPLPAAAWLFVSALGGLVAAKKRAAAR